MSRFLTKLDFHVVCRPLTEQKASALPSKFVRCLLLRVVMPDCDGWTLLIAHDDSELADIPVLMVPVVDNDARGLHLGSSISYQARFERDRSSQFL